MLKTIFAIFVASHCFAASENANDKFKDLIARLVNEEEAAFANEYIREAYNSWQNSYPQILWEVDTSFSAGNYEEVWLQSQNHSANIKIGLLFSPGHPLKVFDVRNILVENRQSFQNMESEVLKFIERMVWQYQLPDNKFILDLLYPDYIGLRYQGLSNKNDIVELLKQKHANYLPTESLGWENEGHRFNISIHIDGQFNKLQIQIDINKYLVSSFFDLEDKVARTNALRDSIAAWIKVDNQRNSKPGSFSLNASSPSSAINSFIDKFLKEFDVAVLEQAEEASKLTIRTPSFEKHVSIELQYILKAKAIAKKQYEISASMLNSNILEGSNQNLSHIKIKGVNEDKIEDAVQQTVHRYSSLGIPDIFNHTSQSKITIDGKVHLVSMQNSEFYLNDFSTYLTMLKKISKDLTPTFLLRNVIDENGKIKVSGYVILQSEKKHWHHLIEIAESYNFDSDKLRIESIALQLYPFINTQALKGVMSLTEQPDYNRRKIQIRK